MALTSIIDFILNSASLWYNLIKTKSFYSPAVELLIAAREGLLFASKLGFNHVTSPPWPTPFLEAESELQSQ